MVWGCGGWLRLRRVVGRCCWVRAEEECRDRTGRQGEGLGDGTGGCTHRSPSEARAEELPLRWGKQGAGSACINNPGNRAG